jgi:hypothetical protein
METNRSAEVEFSLHKGPRPRAGSEMDAGRLPRVTQVLALALSFQDMIASGSARNYEDLAHRTGVTAERLSQVMKLIWLAPAIQREILYLPGCGGRHPLTECAVRSIAAMWSWPEQLQRWSALKKELHLETAVEEQGEPHRV